VSLPVSRTHPSLDVMGTTDRLAGCQSYPISSLSLIVLMVILTLSAVYCAFSVFWRTSSSFIQFGFLEFCIALLIKYLSTYRSLSANFRFNM